MTKAEIIASLKDQAKDKDILANGEKDSIFTRDAQALREAAEMLEKSEVVNGTPADNGMGFWMACGRFGKPLEPGEYSALTAKVREGPLPGRTNRDGGMKPCER